MKTFIFLFSLFTLIPLEVSAGWKIRDTVLPVTTCPNKGCYISKSCLEKNAKCEAFKAYTHPKKGTMQFGGANPGSKVCKEGFSGNVNIAVDEDGNQEGFCVFADGSMLSLGGVWK